MISPIEQRGAAADHSTSCRGIPGTLQAYLGHRSVQRTIRYAELAPKRFKNLLKDRSLGRFTSTCVNYSTLLNRESTYRANFSLALGPVANGGFLFKQPFKTEFHKATRSNRPVSLIVAGFRAGKRSIPAHILRMTEKPKFHSKMIKNGRWTVVVTTGYGPESRVGDFATEEEAQRWISTKSKDWSPPTADSK